tara:strand:- start:1096 stop:2139 length:1044 start_codon:yes stop_codon:yes gene_type:complete
MGEDLANQEIRKLQSTGISTFTISLPKPWVLKHKLSARDPIRIDWRPSGALRITPLNSKENLQRKIYFSTKELPENSLHDHLMGAYISGADVIEVLFEPQNKKKISREIRRFLRGTRGFEIFEEGESKIELICIMNAGELPLHASLNRMYLQLSALIRDIVSVFQGEQISFIEDYEDREAEVDALLYLIERQVRISLDSHSVSKNLEISRTQALEYANLAKSLERMMDHAHTLAHILIQNPNIIENMINMKPIEQIPIWQDSLKELMINIRERDSKRIEKARHSLKEVQKNLIILEQDLLENHLQNQWIPFNLKTSESIRRLCAYARDFGEILLNVIVYRKISITID